MYGTLTFLGLAGVLAIVVPTSLLVREIRHPPRRTAGWALARGLPVDPGELGLEFDQWSVARGRHRIHVYEVHGQTDSPPVTVVMVHRYSGSGIELLNHVQALAPFVSRVILFDRAGHGESSGASPLGKGEQSDLLTIVGRCGQSSTIVLVGFRDGAAIARQAGADAPELISGLVEVQPERSIEQVLRRHLQLQSRGRWPFFQLALLCLKCAGLWRRWAAAEATVPSITIELSDQKETPDVCAHIRSFIERVRSS